MTDSTQVFQSLNMSVNFLILGAIVIGLYPLYGDSLKEKFENLIEWKENRKKPKLTLVQTLRPKLTERKTGHLTLVSSNPFLESKALSKMSKSEIEKAIIQATSFSELEDMEAVVMSKSRAFKDDVLNLIHIKRIELMNRGMKHS